MKWLESRAIIEKEKPELVRQAAQFKQEHGRAPCLAIILVGNDERSEKFVSLKQKFGEEVGVFVRLIRYEAGISGNTLRSELAGIVHNPANDAVIIQLPIPDIDSKTILDAVTLAKDVDGLSTDAVGDFVEGKALFIPPVAEAVEILLGHHGITLLGKRIALVGLGRLVGRPVLLRLLQLGVFPCPTDIDDPFLQERLANADIVITGVGNKARPHFITGDMLKEGVVVVDIAGNVESESVARKASFLTPLRGGVGPLTVMLLIRNTIKAAQQQAKKK